MKKCLMFVLIIILTNVAYSNNDYQDVIYLKNGGIIRGMIIEQIPNKSIKIKTADSNVLVFKSEEIKKITKELKEIYSNSSGLKKGYKGIVTFSYLLGIGDFQHDRVKFDFINGYQVNPYISIGVGIGFRYYTKSAEYIIPFFYDTKITFSDSELSPFFSLGIGSSIGTNGLSNDIIGFIFNPAFGMTIKGAYSNVNIGIGYELQQFIETYYEYGFGYVSRDEYIMEYGAFELFIGISF